MWLLTCDGNLLNGSTIWLRPGSQHLLGRTTGNVDGQRVNYIEHRNVSRKHLTITVDEVPKGGSTKLYTRSTVHLVDNSRIGTILNGHKFTQGSKTLDGAEQHTFKLGSCEQVFRITWRPVVVSYTALTKKKDPMEKERSRLEAADIKLVGEYVSGVTTHAVSKKRNTAANLRALVEGKWLVTEDFTSALGQAATPPNEDVPSPLENDFGGNWPREEKFQLAPGSEPNPRDGRYYHPKSQRAEVFNDFTFVFLVQAQFDDFLPVITSGGGKALLRSFDEAQSTVSDLVDYIKSIAGHKGDTQFNLSQMSGPGAIVIVRPSNKDNSAQQFLEDVEQATGQSLVEQRDFLDAILTSDAAGLRRPAPEIMEPAASNPSHGEPETPQPQPQRQSQRAVTIQDSPPAESQPPTGEQADQDPPAEEPAPPEEIKPRRQRRYVTQSRFQGTFDDFDPSQFAKPVSQSPEPSFGAREASQAPSVQSMDVDDPSQAPPTQQSSRKRRAPVEEMNNDELFPAHTAAKKRRTATETTARGAARDDVVKANVAAEKAKVKTKKAKEVDVMTEIKKRRAKEDEERRKDEESLREAMEGVDFKELMNLAQVEGMEMPVRDRPARAAGQNGQTDRWDPSWNGRKNFKKFRRQGTARDGPRLQRVIVTLEEMPRKGHGIGDEYWLQSSTNRSKSKSQSQSQRQGASRSQHGVEDDEDEDTLRFRRNLRHSRMEDNEEGRVERIHREEIAGHARDEALEAEALPASTQTLRGSTQRRDGGKRPAAQQGGGPAKRAKLSRAPAREVVDLDEDDDDDELKFRRRR